MRPEFHPLLKRIKGSSLQDSCKMIWELENLDLVAVSASKHKQLVPTAYNSWLDSDEYKQDQQGDRDDQGGESMITRMTKMIKMNEVTKVTILITLTNLGTRRSGRVCQRPVMVSRACVDTENKTMMLFAFLCLMIIMVIIIHLSYDHHGHQNSTSHHGHHFNLSHDHHGHWSSQFICLMIIMVITTLLVIITVVENPTSTVACAVQESSVPPQT